MVNQSNTFPQFGDPDDASRFAQLMGHDQLTDYVGTGLEIDVDYSASKVHVSAGVFYTSKESQVAASDGKEIRSLGFVSQVGDHTLDLPESGVYHVVADSDIDTTDNPHVELYEDGSEVPEAALVIGSVDVDEESVTESSREPDGAFNTDDLSTSTSSQSVDADESFEVEAESGLVVSGPFRVDGELIVNGSMTDTVGPIGGYGSITGSGRIKASGGGRHIEPVDPEIDGNTFVVRTGWQTSLTEDSYNSYRFPKFGTLNIERGESLRFEI